MTMRNKMKEKENDFVKRKGNMRKNVCVREEWKWKKRMEEKQEENGRQKENEMVRGGYRKTVMSSSMSFI
jgi:hypothetical protein